MPNYYPRNREEFIPQEENLKMNIYGAGNIIEPKHEEPNKPVDLLGGAMTDEIIEAKKPHTEMIKAVLKMKPRDIHILKKSAKYFLDNPDELNMKIHNEALEDLSKTINSNDLADMLEEDFEMSNGGDLDGNTLLEQLALLFNEIPKIQKIISI